MNFILDACHYWKWKYMSKMKNLFCIELHRISTYRDVFTVMEFCLVLLLEKSWKMRWQIDSKWKSTGNKSTGNETRLNKVGLWPLEISRVIFSRISFRLPVTWNFRCRVRFKRILRFFFSFSCIIESFFTCNFNHFHSKDKTIRIRTVYVFYYSMIFEEMWYKRWKN